VSAKRILDSARKCFEAVGYRRANIAEIAREAGVSAGTIYRHFENKEDLLLRVLAEADAEWLSRVRATLAKPGSALERIARLGFASVEYNRENRLLNAVLNRDREMIPAPLIDQLHDELMEENVAMMADVIREGVEEGSLRELDPESTAFVLFESGRALFSQERRGYDELMPVLLDIITQGIVNPGRKRGRC